MMKVVRSLDELKQAITDGATDVVCYHIHDYIAELLNHLGSENSVITSLDLGDNNIGLPGVESLADALS